MDCGNVATLKNTLQLGMHFHKFCFQIYECFILNALTTLHMFVQK